MTRPPRLAPLAAALLLALPGLAAAQSPEPAEETPTPKQLDAIEVTASPLRNTVDNLARPVLVLTGTALEDSRAGTLGQTLDGQTGVQSSYFGAGVGRPIIRGQDGARVQVINNGTGTGDVSTVSVDHAVTIEPFLADQIEVLKGPATLLYGSGAIGGAVNVVDGRVPLAQLGKTAGGRAEIRYGDGASERTGMARFDADAGALTLHADLFRRESNDYQIPGFAFSPELIAEEIAEGEDISEFARGRLPNSALTTEGGALGGSWFGEKAWFGAAASTYRTDYGIPPGAHKHEHSADPNAVEEEAEIVRLDMRQDRFDFRGGVNELGGAIEEMNYRLTRTLYEHVELEGDEVGTQFENTGTDARLELVQREINGWRGAFGLQYGHRDFSALGDEAFVPPSVTRDLGLFVLQERDFGDFKLELGARHDRVKLDPEADASVDRNATSLAAGGIWRFSELVHLSVNLDRAERSPTAEELFSDGPHIATGSFEIGDRSLDTETALSGELGLHLHHGRFEGKASVYRTNYSDFIYLTDTGLELDDLPVRAWIQDDANFTGWELEGLVDVVDNASGLWSVRLFADGVDAELDDGGNLPRIVPGRIGAGVNWQLGPWRARVAATQVDDQNDVAVDETPTSGYTLLDAGLAYEFDLGGGGWEAFLEGRNLTDREARVHTSFLKDYAPLPGRNIAAGVRVRF
jgi:iron complex outermembrane receptor protein